MDSTTAAIRGDPRRHHHRGLSLVGVILSNRAASSRMQEPLERLTCKVVASCCKFCN